MSSNEIGSTREEDSDREWTIGPYLLLVFIGSILGVAFESTRIVSGARRYTGREVITLNPELVPGTLVIGAVIVLLFVGLLASTGGE